MTKRTLLSWIACGIICAALIPLSGCVSLEELQAQSAAMRQQLEQVDERIDGLQGMKAELQQNLADTEARLDELPADDERRAEWAEQVEQIEGAISHVENALARLRSNADTISAQIIATDEAIQAAESRPEAIGAMIEGGGKIAAPFAGPWAPLVLFATNAANTLLTGLMANRKGKKSGATAVAAPLNEARRADLEAQLAENGQDVLVFERRTARAAHRANGARNLIKAAE